MSEAERGLTPMRRQRLAMLSAQPLILDRRSQADHAAIAAYLELYQLGFCTLVETGRGDSVLKFMITERGRQALGSG